MEIRNEFGSMSYFRSEYPGSFFISALITCPVDKIQYFAGSLMVVNLGVEDFGDFEFWFVIDNNWWGWRLNMIRDWVWDCWFQHGYMKNWVYSAETVIG